MKITLKELVEAKPSLDKLLNADLPVKISFRLARLLNEIQSPLRLAEENRVKLIDKYGDVEVNEESKQPVKIVSDPAKFELFFNEYNGLLSEEIDISSFTPLPLEDLGDVELSAVDVMRLRSVIECDLGDSQKPPQKEASIEEVPKENIPEE